MINVIIPAAGFATRMRPLSSNSSKAMIPVNGKPIIAHILDHILTLENIGDIVIVQNHLKDLETFVSARYSNIKFVEQKFPEGPLQAIEMGSKVLDNSGHSVLVWLGDTICFNTQFDFSESFLGVHPVEDRERWCLAHKTENGIKYYDKPSYDDDVPTSLSLIGIYHFNDGDKFDRCVGKAMKLPKLKNEYQISSLLSIYENFELTICNEWHDVGELHTFYKTKAKLLNRLSREFNKIEVDTKLNILTKSALGEKVGKIEAEKNWYNSLNEQQSIFVPRQFKSELGEIKMTWETGTPLSEIFLYENVSKDGWTTIVNKVWDIMDTVFHTESGEMNLNLIQANFLMQENFQMYLHQPLDRISKYDFCSDEDKALAIEFIKNVGYHFVSNPMLVDCIHGDLHFGNIIFEPTNGSVKFIDPRGKWGNITTTIGDIRYDYAKILHDWVGNYIAINYEQSNINKEIFEHIKMLFEMKIEDRLGEEQLQLIKDHSIVLILTCIPFHSNSPNKQIKFWEYAIDYIKRNCVYIS